MMLYVHIEMDMDAETPQCLPVEFAVHFSTILLQPFILIVSSLDLTPDVQRIATPHDPSTQVYRSVRIA